MSAGDLSKASPRPWRAEGWEQIIVNDRDGLTLAIAPGAGELGTAKANAALIVAAVNNFDGLVSVLRSAENWFGELGHDDGAQGLLDDIRLALAKAAGGAA